MNNDIKYYTVSQVTEFTGATAAQLKNWDKTGLLVAQRTGDGVANNRKLYTQGDVEKVREIMLYRSLDFGLEEIGRMLEATPEERARLVSERACKLKLEYSNIQKQIELATVLEVFTPEALLNELDSDDALSARDEYNKDENLRMMVRWIRSHTQQDIDSFSQDLSEVLDDFFELDADSSWEEVELRLLHFCDVWSKPFGWPTVGQMLDFARIFQELADEGDTVENELSDLFDKGACNRISDIFYLAWADNALRVLDDILVCTFKSLQDEPPSLGDFQGFANDLGEILCWYVCEMGSRPHLYKGEQPPEHPEELRSIADAVFGLLEHIVLDAEVGQYLDIETLFTIEQQSLDFAYSLALAFAENGMDEWISASGYSLLIEQWGQWRKTLREYWIRTHSDEFETLQRDAENAAKEHALSIQQTIDRAAKEGKDILPLMIEHCQTAAESKAFDAWFYAHYERVFADPPQARWIVEEEAIAHEKKMRTLAQEMIAQQEDVAGSALEADE